MENREEKIEVLRTIEMLDAERRELEKVRRSIDDQIRGHEEMIQAQRKELRGMMGLDSLVDPVITLKIELAEELLKGSPR